MYSWRIVMDDWLSCCWRGHEKRARAPQVSYAHLQGTEQTILKYKDMTVEKRGEEVLYNNGLFS